ncbi:MAG: glucosamine kinase [Saprospiraceae bacterium]|jgi:N-acetylglucosamine kinase-like BadF-type ATPase
MILVVDSGSTKTDWAIIDGANHTCYFSPGINPSSDLVFRSLAEHNSVLAEMSHFISHIYYYGAGVIDGATKKRIQDWLVTYFKNASEIKVSSDLLGACKSLAGDKKGIVSILGTGCNSCTFDGQKVTDNIPALGYALSNEGAGTAIGKAILQSYFYRKMPADIKLEFKTKYKVDKSSVVHALYQEPNPTAFLAKHASFINETSNKEWRRSILAPLFQSFIDIRIKSYFDYSAYELYFVGSIAYFCQDILKEILENNNLQVAEIIQKPIDGLIKYHNQKQS